MLAISAWLQRFHLRHVYLASEAVTTWSARERVEQQRGAQSNPMPFDGTG
jgi:hypothetical protein